jgi:hypothetical protein
VHKNSGTTKSRAKHTTKRLRNEPQQAHAKSSKPRNNRGKCQIRKQKLAHQNNQRDEFE